MFPISNFKISEMGLEFIMVFVQSGTLQVKKFTDHETSFVKVD
jgi:hypothetical protein